jgi:hypothetical protein
MHARREKCGCHMCFVFACFVLLRTRRSDAVVQRLGTSGGERAGDLRRLRVTSRRAGGTKACGSLESRGM